jgi:hypothetical protein
MLPRPTSIWLYWFEVAEWVRHGALRWAPNSQTKSEQCWKQPAFHRNPLCCVMRDPKSLALDAATHLLSAAAGQN